MPPTESPPDGLSGGIKGFPFVSFSVVVEDVGVELAGDWP